MRSNDAAALEFTDLAVGQTAEFETFVTAADIDRFAEISGDASPLHVDPAFAAARGFAGRVVHGVYLAALASRLSGMLLPGRNSLLLSVSFSFATAVVAETRLKIVGRIAQLSEAVQSAVMHVRVLDGTSLEPVARGKLVIGFTKDQTCG